MDNTQQRNWTEPLAALALTAWVGGLWAIGYLAVPTLFYAQADRLLAGMLAGHMFTKIATVGLVCGLYLLYYLRKQRNRLFWICFTMFLINALILFGLQPMMAELKTHNINLPPYQQQFKMLHGISSLCYLLESLLGLIAVVLFKRPAP